LREEAWGFAETASAITPELVQWHGRLVALTAKLFGEQSPEMREVAGIEFETFPEFLSAIERQFGGHKDADRLIAEGCRHFFRRRMDDAAEVIAGLLHAIRQRRGTNPSYK
jgi:hypothetical protein